ncbi:MAG: hypothetical protein AB1690_10685 [Candidatus Zixiibacteriota bacterium]|jgi:uncharacterized membrane protein
MADSFFKEEKSEQDGKTIPSLDEPLDARLRESEILKDQSLIASILAYIPFLCLIPILQMRDDPRSRFHSRQGLLLFLIEIIAGIFLIPGLSSMVWKTVLILALGASAAGIIFGLQGKEYRLPIIGDIAEKIKI